MKMQQPRTTLGAVAGRGPPRRHAAEMAGTDAPGTSTSPSWWPLDGDVAFAVIVGLARANAGLD